MAEAVRPFYINEDRVGVVEPIDKDGKPAPVDLTKPYEYKIIGDANVVDLSADPTTPLHFRVRFKLPNIPVTLAFSCFNVIGEQIQCATTYTGLELPVAPVVAVGGRLTIL